MRPLPERPDLDQLRRQARELLRGARAGDANAQARLAAVAQSPSLGAAQLALAREHGFASWTSFKSHVEELRGAAAAAPLMLRRIASVAELRAVLTVVGAQFDPPILLDDRRLLEVTDRFPEDAPLMVAVRNGREIVAGAAAFRSKSGLTLRIIGVVPRWRRQGLGRRMVEVIEIEAMEMGATSISLGAVHEARGFYEALGYRGKRTGKSKSFAPPSRVRDYKLASLRAAIGDVEAGAALTVTWPPPPDL